jgi:hypothetical protein
LADQDEIARIESFIETGSLGRDFPEEFRLSLTWKGILLTLRLDGSSKAVNLLKKIGSQVEKPEYCLLAVRFLGELAVENQQGASEALFELANGFEIAPAIEFLKTHSDVRKDIQQETLFLFLTCEIQEYKAFDPHQAILSELFFSLPGPLQERVTKLAPVKGLRNWAVVVKSLLNPEFLPELVEIFPQCQDFERRLFFRFVEKSAQISKPIQNSVCQIFVLYDYIPARELAFDRSLCPDDPVQAALFFFLAEDWIHYEEIDFDHRLLNTAYELAGQAVRRKILALSRATGQVEWMKNLTAGSQTRWLNELSDPEWDATIQTLLVSTRMADLWLLAQAAPPLWSGRIVLALDGAHWVPERDEEKSSFLHLVELAIACREHPYTILPQTTWQSPTREVTSIALDRNGTELASGNSQMAILRWHLNAIPTPNNTIFSPVPGVNAMIFSPDGSFLAVASGDHKTRIFDLSRGAIIKVLEGHTGLVRSLAFQPDGRYLHTASFDGTVQSWRFPNGIRHNLISASKRELFGLAIAPDGKLLLCAGAEKKIQVYSLPAGDLVRSIEGHQDTITLLSTAPVGTQAASFSRDLTLKFWNYTSGKEIGSVKLIEPLTSLVFHPSGKYIFGGSLKGKLHLWSFPDGQILHTLDNATNALVGLSIDKTGEKLISASSSGKFCQWDLSLFNSLRTPVELLLSSSRAFKQDNDKKVKDSQAWQAFLDELIRWRKRFDIEVSDIHPILHLDEYDIEL